MTQTVPLFFPIEVQNRELDFRLFLAGLCAQPGRKIFVGQHDTIYRLARRANGGVYVGKNLFRSLFPNCELDRYQTLKDSGLSFIHLDEEGLPFEREPADRDAYLLTRLDPRHLAVDDVVCTWGDYERDYYRSLNPPCRENIITTGHPRFDLCTPAYRSYYGQAIEQIEKQYGPFVVINTNFLYQVSLPNLADTFSPQMGYDAANETNRTRYIEHWAHLSRVLIEFVRFANALSVRFPHINVVFRPHPAESTAYYQTIFKDVPNVHVAHEGSVIPWLMAAKALVHNGCTTATEAALSGTPVVTLESISDGYVEYFYANLIGRLCSCVAEAVDITSEILNGGEGFKQDLKAMPNFELAASLLNNYRQPAYPLLVDAIDDVAQRYAGRPIDCDEAGFLREFNNRRNLQRAKRVLRTISPVKKRHYQKSLSHSPHSLKFPDLQEPKIAEKMAGVQAILNKELRWKFINSQLIAVEAG